MRSLGFLSARAVLLFHDIATENVTLPLAHPSHYVMAADLRCNGSPSVLLIGLTRFAARHISPLTRRSPAFIARTLLSLLFFCSRKWSERRCTLQCSAEWCFASINPV